MNDFKKSKERIKLTLLDVLSKKEILLAETSAQNFEPLWIDSKTLEYSLGKKRVKISDTDILAKFK